MSTKKKLIETGDLVVVVVEKEDESLDFSTRFTQGKVYEVMEGQEHEADMFQLINDDGDSWYVYPEAVKPIKKIYAKELE